MNTERLGALYPALSDKELEEAGENLRRYFACALQIASRADPTPVDKLDRPPTIEERSLRPLKNYSD
jgi:hypothetical protein